MSSGKAGKVYWLLKYWHTFYWCAYAIGHSHLAMFGPLHTTASIKLVMAINISHDCY